MRLRQVALVAADYEPTADILQAVLGLGKGYNDPGIVEFGLTNIVFPVGDTFLEIIEPVKDHTTAERLLDKRGGDGGYMVIFQTHRTKEEEAARMKEKGVRIIWDVEHDDAKTIHLHPKDIGGAIVSIDEMKPPESWRWAGPDWEKNTRRDVTTEVIGADVQGADPDAMAERWADVLGVPLEREKGPTRIQCGESFVRFLPEDDDRGEGVAGFHIRAADPAAVFDAARSRDVPIDGTTLTIGGAKFHIVAPDAMRM